MRSVTTLLVLDLALVSIFSRLCAQVQRGSFKEGKLALLVILLLQAIVLPACTGSSPSSSEELTPTPEPTPTPVPISVSEFGFRLALEGTYSINASPVLDKLANKRSGQLLWAKGDTRYVLSWRPIGSFTTETEKENARLASLDQALINLQAANPTLATSEVSPPGSEDVGGLAVVYKTFLAKVQEKITKGLTGTFDCKEQDREFIFGVLLTEEPLQNLKEILSGFRCQ